MNLHTLFKPISPLYAWFWFMQTGVALCIVGYWVEACGHRSLWLMDRVPAAAGTTILFIIATGLIFRRRVVGVIASLVAWILVWLLITPSL